MEPPTRDASWVEPGGKLAHLCCSPTAHIGSWSSLKPRRLNGDKRSAYD